MKVNKTKAEMNIEHAKRWLNRSIKDFNLFKKLVPFDKRTYKPVICSDPALAVYVLQQCIEKAVKATAIASAQYDDTKDFRHFYSHNSLALIVDLYNKILTKTRALGLDFVSKTMGVDLVEGESKLSILENQVMGKIPLLTKNGEKADFKSESINISPAEIDQILDVCDKTRRLMLDVIRTTFSLLPDMGIRKGQETVDNAEEFIKKLTEKLSDTLKIIPPSDEQIKFPIEFVNQMSNIGFEFKGSINRREMIENYLGVWALSNSLLFLTYFTFAHESTSRYPLKQKGNVKKGKIGCDDYNNSLGIVNRIGRIGYSTSLTLNEMKNNIESIALFFAVE